MKEKTAAISTELCLLGRISELETLLKKEQAYREHIGEYIMSYCEGRVCLNCGTIKPELDGTRYGYLRVFADHGVLIACSEECKEQILDEEEKRAIKEQETLDELNEYLDSQGNHNR